MVPWTFVVILQMSIRPTRLETSCGSVTLKERPEMRGLVITARQMNWQTLWDLFVCYSGCTTCEAVLVLVEESLFLDLSLSKEKMPSSGQEEFLSGGHPLRSWGTL